MRTYKGYRCKTKFNPDLNLFEGEVLGAGAPIYFEAATKKAIIKEFQASVDSFFEWCAEKGVSPNDPKEDVFITLQLEEWLLKSVEEIAGREGKPVRDWMVQTLEGFMANSISKKEPAKEWTWNYRVVRRSGSLPAPWVIYAVHEVFYEEGNPVWMAEEGGSPAGEDRDELAQDWEHYRAAWVRPVLVFDGGRNKFIGTEPPLEVK